MSAHAPENFIKWLEAAIYKINECERRGREASAKGEEEAYSAAMREKAETLAAMRDEARPYLAEMGGESALDYAGRTLETCSYNADRAIELDSVFYMSALLFPEDHQPGEPHNLEIFRNEMIKRLGL